MFQRGGLNIFCSTAARQPLYVIHLCVFLTTARGSPSHNMRVDARHRRPAAAPRDLARASPALFAHKVLTHHKHLRISTPPLRKPPSAQKALRALRPLARPCGLDQIRPPSKTQAFLGRSNFAHAPALSAIALYVSSNSCTLA